MADILITNGNVLWDGDEIYITSGNDAIKQEAYLMSICDLGESVFYPSYGSNLFKYIGKPYTEANKALIEAEAKEVLLKTEGISEVEKTELSYVNVDDSKFPCIYAKYKVRGNETAQESRFRFLV